VPSDQFRDANYAQRGLLSYRCTCRIEIERSEAMNNSTSDRWLLPRHQTEYPARVLLSEATLHGRREATFLALAAMFLVATTVLVVLGTSRTIDVGALLRSANVAVELPIALLVPLGVLPFALSFVASALVCHLFGRRRASALIAVGLVASLALAGLMRGADVIDGGDAFGVSLAFAACYFIAHTFNVLVFDAFHRRGIFLRMNIASLLAQVAGWSAAGLVLYALRGYFIEPMGQQMIMSLTAGAAACSFAVVLVLSIPATLIGRGLAVALRVGDAMYDDDEDDQLAYDDDRDSRPGVPAFAQGSVARPLPKALIVDDDQQPHGDAERRRTARGVIQPFSSAEMRFFSEGDAAQES
jgi:uncharacterized PurR-regulated membrane protein YhhQ (DUF165 family)